MRSFAVAVAVALLHVTAVAQERPPIIDVHLHAHAADRFGEPGPPNPTTGAPSAAITDEALIQATLAVMRRYNIVLGIASSAQESVERWRLAAPDRIVGGVQIDVGFPMPDLARVRADVLNGQVGMIGEIGAQYLGLEPADSTLAPFFALAEELEIPVSIHTGISSPNTPYECCPAFRVALGRPLLLEPVLIRHPNLRVNLMHAGHPYLDETIALMSVYPNVYADVGAINWILPQDEFYRYLKALMQAGLGRRIMFGSDQMVWPEVISRAIDAIEEAPFLSEEQRRDIFYNNAARFLRLSEEEMARHHDP